MSRSRRVLVEDFHDGLKVYVAVGTAYLGGPDQYYWSICDHHEYAEAARGPFASLEAATSDLLASLDPKAVHQ
jgi:hypothetical protein